MTSEEEVRAKQSPQSGWPREREEMSAGGGSESGRKEKGGKGSKGKKTEKSREGRVRDRRIGRMNGIGRKKGMSRV